MSEPDHQSVVLKRIALGMIAAALTAVVAIDYFDPSMTATSRYATLDAARADRLFERGWLPDILPPSTRDIRTRNNLDSNTSEGDFTIAPAEYVLFGSELHEIPSAVSQKQSIERSAEVDSRSFVDDGATWIFSCDRKSGRCTYKMWTTR
jgi:hypothetical protein